MTTQREPMTPLERISRAICTKKGRWYGGLFECELSGDECPRCGGGDFERDLAQAAIDEMEKIDAALEQGTDG